MTHTYRRPMTHKESHMKSLFCFTLVNQRVTREYKYESTSSNLQKWRVVAKGHSPHVTKKILQFFFFFFFLSKKNLFKEICLFYRFYFKKKLVILKKLKVMKVQKVVNYVGKRQFKKKKLLSKKTKFCRSNCFKMTKLLQIFLNIIKYHCYR